MCHGLRARNRFRTFRLSAAAIACLVVGFGFGHAAAQSPRVAGQGAPPIVAPHSTLRIGDSKRSTPADAEPTAAPTASSQASDGGQGSRLEIRRTLEPQVQLKPQPSLTSQPSPAFQTQPSVTAPREPVAAPSVRTPAYTASSAPLAPRVSLAPRAPLHAATPPTATAQPTSTTPSPTSNDGSGIVIASDGAIPDPVSPMITAQPKPVPAVSPPVFSPPVESPSITFPPTRSLAKPSLSSSPTAPILSHSPDDAPTDLLTTVPLPDPELPGALPKLEPVDFNGVLLGASTVEEVIKAWGEPVRRDGTGNDLKLSYKIDPFDSVDVTFFERKAEAIVIELGDRFPIADILKELALDEADSIAVEDAEGKALGIVFPERGVSLRFEPGPDVPLVATIGLDRISARPFVLRGEKRSEQTYTAALTDLAIALNLDPKNSRAHWLRAKILQKIGRPRAAMEAIESALKIDAKAADYLLTRAELLADEGLFDAALADNETVVAGTKSLPLYQAKAWSQRGDLLAGGPKPDYGQAIDAHTRAVRLVEPLVTSKNLALRRGAKQMLVEAHLAIAQDVAWGEWQSKETVVERWLKKAESIAADGYAAGDLSLDALLDVYVRASAACVGTQGGADPLVWAESLLKTADAVLAESTDPLRRKQIQFDAGLGLYDALQSLHARGDIDNALKYGTAAVEMIQQGRIGRDETPIDGYRFGRLYFRIGSLYAVKRQDHAKAVEWFERAAPLLERPLAEEMAADRGRQGESLVSMGISYWAVGNRERALQLTNVGARYMQQAVRDGMLAAPAMGVAYTNLATMHRQLGDEPTSKKFVEMATRVEPAAADGVLRR